MNTEVTSEELISRLRAWPDTPEQELRALPPARQFELLFPIAAASQSDGPAFPAATLLYRLNPPCTLDCRAAVASMLDGWDVSIEEVPWYLTNQFGSAALHAACDAILADNPPDPRPAILRIVKYWTDLCPGTA